MRFERNQPDSLKILSLGGFGKVTQNFFVYELNTARGGKDILLVDCGVGFPGEINGEGDLLVPDASYLFPFKNHIRGLVLTHGHEDHIGALPYILPKIGLNVPVFGARLTAALAQEKLEEHKIHSKINVVSTKQKLPLGPFLLEFVYVTHSIPDTLNLAIHTPLGTVFHASDFKFDWTPPLGRHAQIGKIASIGNKGVDLMLSDCLRSEKFGYTLSEMMVEDSLEREIIDCPGKFMITTMSSNVSRWQQAVNVCLRHGRKIALAGFSIEKMVEIATNLGYLQIPPQALIRMNRVKRLPPQQVAVFVAGNQGQENSALSKIAAGTHRQIRVQPGDKVVFSADYIPGNEVSIHDLVDQLYRLGATVSYSDILDDLHVSGHAAQSELALMINLVRPKFLVPIGGGFRHMKHYSLLAQKIGYREDQIVLVEGGESVELLPNKTVRKGLPIRVRSSLV